MTLIFLLRLYDNLKLNTKPPIILLELILKKANKRKKNSPTTKIIKCLKMTSNNLSFTPFLNSQTQNNARDGFDAQGRFTVSAKI